MRSYLNKLHKISQSGFTLIEVLVVSPLFILLIGTMIFAVVSLTGSSVQTNEKNALMSDVQTAFDSIESEASSAKAYLKTTGTVTAPQGSDDSTGAAFTTMFDSNPSNYKTNGPIIIQSTATTKSTFDSTREIVYSNSPDNTCNSSTVSSNTPYPVTYVYFVKNNILWKRTILGTSAITGTCSTPYQKPSCAVGYSASFCKSEDEKIMENVGSIEAQFYEKASSPTPLNDPVAAKSMKLTINSAKLVGGNSVTSASTTTINLPSISTATAVSGSAIFNYTGSTQSFTVPAGVTSLTVDALGAQGGTRTPNVGGLGGQAKGTITVTPGQTIYVYVGGTPTSTAGGYNGGGQSGSASYTAGGGGASDIRIAGTTLGDRRIVAGGGGGAGYNCGSGDYGGAGGGSTGQNGSDCGDGTYAGKGGTQSAGGAMGQNNGQGCGTNGTTGVGGVGACTYGGGGGGGYFGGGGGGYGGGGGGSSYLNNVTAGTMTANVQSGNGKVTFTW